MREKIMAILVVRNDGSVIEMPDGAAQFHAQLRENNNAKAVDKRLGRTYQVKSIQGDLHLTEKSDVYEPTQAPVLIRAAKSQMTK
jgi:hypothetical protein